MTQTPPSEFDARIGRLVDRIMQRGVVPFVGAGFSYGAAHPEGWVSTGGRMTEKLSVLLGQAPAVATGNDAIQSLPAGTDLASDTFDALTSATKSNPGLARLAELAALKISLKEVCEQLEIYKYAELQPLASHRYLAYLAREGLVREVITTNYDCCIERAFEQSLALPASTAGGAACVIQSLEQYRQSAAKHNKAGDLIIYKINGCAKVYAKAKSLCEDAPSGDTERAWHNAADRIVLTERQLQTFRRENWARDLFLDRARSRSLLFCGFGSEEPQIRHTAVALMNEFASDHAEGAPPASNQRIVGLANIPFIHVHDAHLSFYQLQILVAFWEAHKGAIQGGADGMRPMMETVFSGLDARAAGPAAKGLTQPIPPSQSATENKLSADLFMQAIFERAFERLVRDQIYQGPFCVWLRQLTGESKLWTYHLECWLGLKGQTAADRMSRLGYLLQPVPDKCSFPLRLWRMIWSVHAPAQAMPAGWYMPMRENALLLMTTLLLMSLSAQEDRFDLDGPDAAVRADQPLGLGVEFSLPARPLGKAQNPSRTFFVHLVSQAALAESPALLPRQQGSRLLRVIAVPTCERRRPLGRWIVRRQAEGPDQRGKLQCGVRVTVSAAELVSAAGRPERFADALQDSFAASRPRSAVRLNLKHSSQGVAE